MEIPAAVWGAGGASGMLGLLYWLLATGRTWTGNSVDRVLQSKDEQITTLKTAIAVKDGQLEKLQIVGETNLKILESVEALARRRKT